MSNISKKQYFLGVSWFMLSLITSVINDIISKYSGQYLPSIEISFFRFLFTTLTLVPFILYYGKQSLKSSRPIIHVVRGCLLFFGISGWTYGITIAPIAIVTIMSFTIPLFTLILAMFFLNEKIIWQRWVATIVGFLGIALIVYPQGQGFNFEYLIFIVGAIMFAMLDIINKKFVIEESMISMLFYSALVTAVLSVGPAAYYWVQPTLKDLILFIILGASANLILYFLLKGFALVDATAVAPYRYLELLMSATLGYFIFAEIPDTNTWLSALIVIPSTLFIIYSENKNNK